MVKSTIEIGILNKARWESDANNPFLGPDTRPEVCMLGRGDLRSQETGQ